MRAFVQRVLSRQLNTRSNQITDEKTVCEQLYSRRWLSTENRYSSNTSSKKNPRQEAKLPTVRVRPGRVPPQDVAAPRGHSQRGRRRWHGGLRACGCSTSCNCRRPNFTVGQRRMNTQYLVSRPMTLVDKLGQACSHATARGGSDLSKVKSRVKSIYSSSFSSSKHAQRPRLEVESN